jgi:hypothetical protein
MSYPKFQIGEEVLLVSKDMPSFNGAYIIDYISYASEQEINFRGKFTHKGYYYQLKGLAGWELHESALRKKHPPARDEETGEIVSFKQIMNNLVGKKV